MLNFISRGKKLKLRIFVNLIIFVLNALYSSSAIAQEFYDSEWRGSAKNNKGKYYKVELSISDGAFYINYPKYNCDGKLFLLSKDEYNSFKFKENLSDSSSECMDGGAIEIYHINDNTLHWKYKKGQYSSEALLIKHNDIEHKKSRKTLPKTAGYNLENINNFIKELSNRNSIKIDVSLGDAYGPKSDSTRVDFFNIATAETKVKQPYEINIYIDDNKLIDYAKTKNIELHIYAVPFINYNVLYDNCEGNRLCGQNKIKKETITIPMHDDDCDGYRMVLNTSNGFKFRFKSELNIKIRHMSSYSLDYKVLSANPGGEIMKFDVNPFLVGNSRTKFRYKNKSRWGDPLIVKYGDDTDCYFSPQKELLFE